MNEIDKIYEEFGVVILKGSEKVGPTKAEVWMAREIKHLRRQLGDEDTTRREYIAIHCLSGMLADPSRGGELEIYVTEAVKIADLLVKHLYGEAET